MLEEQAYYTNQVEQGCDYEMHVCLDFFNKRIRIDDYRGNIDAVYRRMCELADQHALTKAFVKSREEDWPAFLSKGCTLEGIYKGYFLGSDAYCMAVYFDLERRTSDYWIEEDQILGQVLQLHLKPERPQIPADCTLRVAEPEDAEALALLYGQVFQTYPTPMSQPWYVEKVIREGTVFYVVEQAGLLISAASAEINGAYRNAEITDCATLPAYRKLGLMRVIIYALEEELRRRNIYCAYSLARALSFGMNAALGQMGYRYYGRLTKSVEIYDKFEDMNLWVKDLAQKEEGRNDN